MKNATTEDVREALEAGGRVTVINTLSANHFQEAHIPGSINIPLETSGFVGRVEEAAGRKDRPVIVYCASAQCDSSAKAARLLEDAGFTDVTRYEGGVAAWEEAGEPLEVGA